MRHGIYHYHDIGTMVPTHLTMNKDMYYVPISLVKSKQALTLD
jgi:hypothetical protein